MTSKKMTVDSVKNLLKSIDYDTLFLALVSMELEMVNIEFSEQYYNEAFERFMNNSNYDGLMNEELISEIKTLINKTQ